MVGGDVRLDDEGLLFVRLFCRVVFGLDVGCEEVLLEIFVEFVACDVLLLIALLEEAEPFPLLSEVPFDWIELVGFELAFFASGTFPSHFPTLFSSNTSLLFGPYKRSTLGFSSL